MVSNYYYNPSSTSGSKEPKKEACNIYPLSYLLNLARATKIPLTIQHFMGFAGLRGVVAFSLAIRDTSTEVRRTILTTALLLVAFTILVLGAAAHSVLRWLGVRVEVDVNEDPEELSLEVITESPDTTLGLWHHLDYKYLRPALTHSGPPLAGSLPWWCRLLARLFNTHNAYEDQEQLYETEVNDASDLANAENQQVCISGDTESEHQEDLLEGDLGLGTIPPLSREV
ncbi:hypothetical protein LDENG_00065270 [Lucifuga dentata]|nr:hypothetical protein LDENG_00065270 [Lucifuga dentata]